MERMILTNHWLVIAKAEYYLMSLNYRKKRKRTFAILLSVSLIWVFIAPILVPFLLDTYFSDYIGIFSTELPGLLRQYTLLIWIIIFFMPISNALQELKISQWEILLNADVSTRDILVGRFIGRIPHNLILFLFAAPLALSPLIAIFEIPFSGQIIMYATIFCLIVPTLWVSNVIASALQTVLGNNARGEDIAKIVGTMLTIILMFPIMFSMMLPESLAQLLSSTFSLLFPSTWAADIISWTVLFQSGTGFSQDLIRYYSGILIFDASLCAVLLILITIVFIVVGFGTGDRIFTFSLGARTERITTVGKENIIIRGVRRVFPNSNGTLIVTALKEFYRKPQNVITVSLASIVSIIPLLTISSLNLGDLLDIPILMVYLTMVIISIMYPFIGGVIFGLTPHLENKNQLWVIRSAPNGAGKYIKARIISMLISSAPMVLLPTILIIFIMQFFILESIILPFVALALIFSSMMIGIGIGTLNPIYEVTKAGKKLASFISSFGLLFILSIVPQTLGLEYLTPIIGAFGAYALLSTIPMFFVGIVLCWAGTMKFGIPEK